MLGRRTIVSETTINHVHYATLLTATPCATFTTAPHSPPPRDKSLTNLTYHPLGNIFLHNSVLHHAIQLYSTSQTQRNPHPLHHQNVPQHKAFASKRHNYSTVTQHPNHPTYQRFTTITQSTFQIYNKLHLEHSSWIRDTVHLQTNTFQTKARNIRKHYQNTRLHNTTGNTRTSTRHYSTRPRHTQRILPHRFTSASTHSGGITHHST